MCFGEGERAVFGDVNDLAAWDVGVLRRLVVRMEGATGPAADWEMDLLSRLVRHWLLRTRSAFLWGIETLILWDRTRTWICRARSGHCWHSSWRGVSASQVERLGKWRD